MLLIWLSFSIVGFNKNAGSEAELMDASETGKRFYSTWFLEGTVVVDMKTFFLYVVQIFNLGGSYQEQVKELQQRQREGNFYLYMFS